MRIISSNADGHVALLKPFEQLVHIPLSFIVVDPIHQNVPQNTHGLVHALRHPHDRVVLPQISNGHARFGLRRSLPRRRGAVPTLPSPRLFRSQQVLPARAEVVVRLPAPPHALLDLGDRVFQRRRALVPAPRGVVKESADVPFHGIAQKHDVPHRGQAVGGTARENAISRADSEMAPDEVEVVPQHGVVDGAVDSFGRAFVFEYSTTSIGDRLRSAGLPIRIAAAGGGRRGDSGVGAAREEHPRFFAEQRVSQEKIAERGSWRKRAG